MQPAAFYISLSSSPLRRAGKLAGMLLLCLTALAPGLHAQHRKDSIATLPGVRVTAGRFPDARMAAPVQTISRAQLDRINILSAGDAARYFSGVLVKDYGGIGGLKTVSVRSLGASATGVLYDGLPIGDMQSGQVDFSRFSSALLQQLQVFPGSFLPELAPARSFASAATLQLQTMAFQFPGSSMPCLKGSVTYGSNLLVQPVIGWYRPMAQKMVLTIDAAALSSKGDYPFTIHNGAYSSSEKRENSDVKSFQGEINLLKQLADSSTLQLKAGAGAADRGLPGAIVFFNSRSVQRLRENNEFLQFRFNKYVSTSSQLLFVARYSRSWSRYTDPDFLNNQGGLDNRYTQQEGFASAAMRHQLSKRLDADVAADAAYTILRSNTAGSRPSRLNLWDNISLHYHVQQWQVRAGLLYASFRDDTRNGPAASRDRVTPSLSVRFSPGGPWLLRLFYKAAYRVPTFTDLYYGFVSNSALKPELSSQVNAGITWEKRPGSYRLSITADAYYNLVTDKIISVPNQNLFVWTTLNLGKVRITGVDVNAVVSREFSADLQVSGRLAATYQQAIDVSDPAASTWKNRIPYTPDISGSGIISTDWRRWTASMSLLFSGSRYTLGGNNSDNRLPAWFTPDVSAGYRLRQGKNPILVKAALLNFTDQRYDIVRYYPMPGRSFRLSILFNQ